MQKPEQHCVTFRDNNTPESFSLESQSLETMTETYYNRMDEEFFWMPHLSNRCALLAIIIVFQNFNAFKFDTKNEMAILLFSYISSSTKEKNEIFRCQGIIIWQHPSTYCQTRIETILKTSLLKKFLWGEWKKPGKKNSPMTSATRMYRRTKLRAPPFPLGRISPKAAHTTLAVS